MHISLSGANPDSPGKQDCEPGMAGTVLDGIAWP